MDSLLGIIIGLGLVLRQGRFDGFRATRMIQDKAPCEGNGQSFSSTATRCWIIRAAPFGRAVKRFPALLRLLARTGPLPARRAYRSTASRLAEPIKPTLAEYYSVLRISGFRSPVGDQHCRDVWPPTTNRELYVDCHLSGACCIRGGYHCGDFGLFYPWG